MNKIKAMLLCTIIAAGSTVTSCEKKEANDDLRILHENVMQGCLYKRKNSTQVIQIPVLLNKEIDNFIVSDIEGKNIDIENINVDGGIDNICNGVYEYLISLAFDWNNYKYMNDEVVIESFKFIVDGQEYDYDFGKFSLIETANTCENEVITYGACGTGYTTLDFIDFELDFEDNAEITAINTTIDLPFTNADDFTKEYEKGSHQKFQLEADDTEFNDKLYYAFDLSVNYKYNDNEYVFYPMILPVQTSIENRLPIYIEQQKF